MILNKNGEKCGKKKLCKWEICLDSHLFKELFSFNRIINIKMNNLRIKTFLKKLNN